MKRRPDFRLDTFGMEWSETDRRNFRSGNHRVHDRCDLCAWLSGLHIRENRRWNTGNMVSANDSIFESPTNADKVELANLACTGELPERFTIGESK